MKKPTTPFDEEFEALEKLTELEGSSINLEQLARRVGMSAAYDSMYRGTSARLWLDFRVMHRFFRPTPVSLLN